VVGCSGVKAPIVIGTVGTQSGLVGSSVVEGVRAVQAWAAYANARGGVNCHPVKYVIYDDGGDPSRNQASAQRLVEQDHAIALVQADAPLSGQASVNYLTAKRVPVIGSETASPWFYSSPMYFPQASSGDNLTDLLIATLNKIGRSQGKTKLATLSCVETTTCSRFYSAAPSLAAKYGLALAYRGQASLAQPDFTSICQGAQSAGAQMIGIELDAASVQRVARSCATVNFHPQFGTVVNAAPIPPSDASLEGVAIGENVLPWMITSNPGIAQFHDALRQNAPGVQANPISVGGWVSAKLFEFAVQHVSETPSSQDVLNGLWSMKSNDLGGLTMPLTFVKDQNAPQTPTCYWLLQAKGGQYVSPDGGQRTCA
jgi:branched-chain amino acid transport system substrate-binding protein